LFQKKIGYATNIGMRISIHKIVKTKKHHLNNIKYIIKYKIYF